jgi:hypothetical protein
LPSRSTSLCVEPQELAEDAVKKYFPHQGDVRMKKYCSSLGEDDRTSTKKADCVEEKKWLKNCSKGYFERRHYMMTIDNQRDRVAEEKKQNFLGRSYFLLFK